MLKSLNNINWIAIFILVIAMLITVMPIAHKNLFFMPNWLIIALSICYIIIDKPVGMTLAIITGIFFDVLTGSIFGVNPLCLLIAVYALSKYTANVVYDNMYRELSFVFGLTFFLIMLKTSLLRTTFFPFLFIDYLCCSISTAVTWALLRLCLHKKKSYLV